MSKELEILGKHRIGVLAGGTSSEREISIKSGRAVFESLKENGLNVDFIDIKEDNPEWLDRTDIDTAFIALHGRFGEDGTVQRMLDEKNIIYTGSDPEASYLALDKIASKKIFLKEGLRIPEYKVIPEASGPGSIEDIWIPCVVKPQHEGSSIGLSIVDSKDQLAEAIKNASAYRGDVIVERFIPGREITVGLIEGEALPVIEIIAANNCYDYNAKYLAKDTKYIVPAELDNGIAEKAQEIALRAHNALGCEGFSRVDMRLADSGDIYVLEVNTIPGLTERSLLPMAARAAGIDFFDLCVKVLYEAVNRNRIKGE